MNYKNNINELNRDMDFLNDRMESGNGINSRNNSLKNYNIIFNNEKLNEDFIRDCTFYYRAKIRKSNNAFTMHNKIDFEGTWEKQFTFSNEKVMCQTNEFLIYDTDNYSAIKMDYLYSNFSFIGILPKNDLSLLEINNLIFQGTIDLLISKMKKCIVNIKIPKFKVETKQFIEDLEFRGNARSVITFDINEYGTGNVESTKYRKLSYSEESTTYIKLSYNKESTKYINLSRYDIKFDRPFLYYVVKRITSVRNKNTLEYIPLFMGIYKK